MTQRLTLALATFGILGTFFLFKPGFAGAGDKKKEQQQQQQQPERPQAQQQQPKQQPQQRPQSQQHRPQPQYQQQRPQPQYQQRPSRRLEQQRQQPTFPQPRQQPPLQQPGQQRPMQQPRMLTPAESQQHIQELNRNRSAMKGINARSLPFGEVTVHPDGRRTLTASGGRQFDLRPNGTVARVSLGDGRTAAFRPDGKIRSLNAKGMQVNYGLHGERQIVSDHNTYRVVSMGANRGYLQRAYITRNGQTYMQRTYVVNNVTYTRVYSTYVYSGVTYYRYVPVYYYQPAFYGWAYNPWPAPVYYNWGWSSDPWYTYYGPYFTPFPAYPTASLWLTDYLLAENLRMAYQTQTEDRAAAQQQAESSAAQPAPTGNAYTTQLTPEVKQAITEEVKQQIMAERVAAGQTGSANSQQLGPVEKQAPPPALDPAQRVYVVSSNLNVAGAGQECALTSGDIITRLTDTPDQNQNVNASVLCGKATDCVAGSQVAVSVQDLQEMHNRFREQIDSGLQTLAQKQSKDGLPAAPDTRTSAGEVPPPAPDPNVARALDEQQKAADEIAGQVQQQAFVGQTQAAQTAVTPSPVPGEPATVVVKSTPDGADVTVDGKFVGSTPAALRLAPGDHTIAIEKSGYKAWQRTLSVTSGGINTIAPTLERAF